MDQIDKYNSSPLKGFYGLSPNDMNSLLHQGINKPDSVCVINQTIDNDILKSATFFSDMRLLLNLIYEQKSIALTATGCLPPKICTILAEAEALGEDLWWYKHKKSKLVTESNFHYIHLLHLCIKSFGLARKEKKRILLTKRGESLLLDPEHIKLYSWIIEAYMTKFNWAYSDSYPKAYIIQQGILFSVYLLQKYGNEDRRIEFYTDKFLEAFPATIGEFTDSPYHSATKQMINCYDCRVFKRFLNRFGLITLTKTQDDPKRMPTHTIAKTPLLDQLFSWQNISWESHLDSLVLN